jgi:hypothetical protein
VTSFTKLCYTSSRQNFLDCYKNITKILLILVLLNILMLELRKLIVLLEFPILIAKNSEVLGIFNTMEGISTRSTLRHVITPIIAKLGYQPDMRNVMTDSFTYIRKNKRPFMNETGGSCCTDNIITSSYYLDSIDSDFKLLFSVGPKIAFFLSRYSSLQT